MLLRRGLMPCRRELHITRNEQDLVLVNLVSRRAKYINSVPQVGN